MVTFEDRYFLIRRIWGQVLPHLKKVKSLFTAQSVNSAIKGKNNVENGFYSHQCGKRTFLNQLYLGLVEIHVHFAYITYQHCCYIKIIVCPTTHLNVILLKIRKHYWSPFNLFLCKKKKKKIQRSGLETLSHFRRQYNLSNICVTRGQQVGLQIMEPQHHLLVCDHFFFDFPCRSLTWKQRNSLTIKL